MIFTKEDLILFLNKNKISFKILKDTDECIDIFLDKNYKYYLLTMYTDKTKSKSSTLNLIKLKSLSEFNDSYSFESSQLEGILSDLLLNKQISDNSDLIIKKLYNDLINFSSSKKFDEYSFDLIEDSGKLVIGCKNFIIFYIKKSDCFSIKKDGVRVVYILNRDNEIELCKEILRWLFYFSRDEYLQNSYDNELILLSLNHCFEKGDNGALINDNYLYRDLVYVKQESVHWFRVYSRNDIVQIKEFSSIVEFIPKYKELSFDEFNVEFELKKVQKVLANKYSILTKLENGSLKNLYSEFKFKKGTLKCKSKNDENWKHVDLFNKDSLSFLDSCVERWADYFTVSAYKILFEQLRQEGYSVKVSVLSKGILLIKVIFNENKQVFITIDQNNLKLRHLTYRIKYMIKDIQVNELSFSYLDEIMSYIKKKLCDEVMSYIKEGDNKQ